ncbi:MAG TPA: 16S rRNA (adenine(1518)-N(6)/adenine(1519)-N(6))-dimethyltransferase RsmA [Candidatus Polarisedimenticolia bacterium]|nr:16S rRNA (adenine(1518)-N(6)/adenine(1519)-N(6))-dimethyltransferase RsmA [Candidatus Polarisedimenticolia bacterium]
MTNTRMRIDSNRFHASRRLGQNFLVNQGAADTIVLALNPHPGDLLLEVGPGRGVLTRRLSGRVARLLAIEIDPRLAASLAEDLRGDSSVEIVTGDILELSLKSLLETLGATQARRARVIANLPYSIGTTVILRLVEERALLDDMVVLVQREVAERIVSPPGTKTYGALSVLCQARARVESLLRLRPGSFRPVPKVESMLIRLTMRPSGTESAPSPGDRPGALESLLRVAFAQRRKTLLNNLARLPGPRDAPIGSAAAESLIRASGLDPSSRPEDVPVDGFLAILRAREAL